MHNPFSKKYRKFLTPQQKKVRNTNRVIAIVSGILLGLSFPPFPFPYFLFIALVPFLFVIEKFETLGEINRFTYLTMFIFTLVSLHWVGSWTTEADPFLMVAGGTLMFFEPIVFLIPTTFYFYARKVFNKIAALLLLPLFWVTYEYAYSITDFQFPWLTLGHGLAYFTSFIQIADTIGSFGLTLIIIYINIFLYLGLRFYKTEKKVNIKYIVLGIALFLIPLFYGITKINNYIAPRRTVKVGLLQPDFDPTNRWDGGTLSEQVNTYFRLADSTVANGAEIIIMSESALPVYLLNSRNKATLEKFYNYCDSNNVAILTGMPDATIFLDKSKAPEEAKPLKSSDAVYVSYNSVLLFLPGTKEVQKYGKIKLVPFGEKVPYVEKIPILGDIIKWNVGISSWNNGKDIVVFKIPFENDTIGVAGIVCIESIYSDFNAQFVQKGAEFIAVITNDSWYGNSSGPYQHKEISVLRAVENKRSVVRAANGGISCLIDPIGRTISETEMFTQRAIVVDTPIIKELTFYTTYPLLFPMISVIGSGIIILFVIVNYFRRKFVK